MKLSLKNAKILQELIEGKTIPNSQAKGLIIERLVDESILLRKGRHRKTLHLLDDTALADFLANQLQIRDLEEFITAKKNDSSSRSEFVKVTTDSKHSKERAFKGFLLNSFKPIPAKLNGKKIKINPPKGSFKFISDYENFEIEKDVVIVGVENTRNFSLIHQQAYLFPKKHYLFLSRYPQTQNRDVLQWLQSIPNPYLHFGDFDLAGIGIFMNEYKKYLKNRASFFIPDGVENKIKSYGNRERYNLQKVNFDIAAIDDNRLRDLITLLHQERKGLDQEVFISHF